MTTDEELLGPLDPAWDRAPGDGRMTDFKRRARHHQARWRSERSLSVGEHPPGKKNGAVLTTADGDAYKNFISDAVVNAVRHRLHIDNKQHAEQLDANRLRNHLLSSMPMCFNLFGELHDEPSRLSSAGAGLWGVHAAGQRVEFEWSPGRLDQTYTADRTAFDAALVFGESGETETVIAIETKYHEHAVREAPPHETKRMSRYREITEASGAFHADWEERIVGTELQQIWRDHLLLLSMLQHPSHRWRAGKYVLVYPAGNTSFRQVAEDYAAVLTDSSTFSHTTVEALLEAHLLHQPDTEEAFRARYLF